MLVGCLSLTLGDLRDPSDIRRCLASIRATASACSCPQGGPARWVNDSRCACDHAVPAASCDAVIAWSPASGVFAVPGLDGYGLTTLLRDFFGHLARACAAGEHLLYGGFRADGLTAATATPRLSPESFFDLDELNVALRKQRGCERTQVLPQSCATAEQHLPNITRCDRKIDWGHAPMANLLANTLPLNFTPAVSAAPLSDAVPATYNAVHFNLDCDWLLYLERRNGTRNRFTKYHHRDHPRAMTNALCGGGDVHINALGTAMAHSYARATASVASKLPWLVVTSIGKPGHSAAQWVLDGYLRALPNLTFFRSGTQSRYREINAAAELGLLLGARNFVGLHPSTFSKFAAQRLDQKSNGSVITLICRCTKCCVADVPPSDTQRQQPAPRSPMIKRSGRGDRPTARGDLDVAGGSGSSPVNRTRGAVDHRRYTQSEDTNCYAKRYPDLMVRYCHGSMCDIEGLRDHFGMYGRGEGRCFQRESNQSFRGFKFD